MYRFGWQTDRTLECRVQKDRCSSFRFPHPADCLSSGPGVRGVFSVSSVSVYQSWSVSRSHQVFVQGRFARFVV